MKLFANWDTLENIPLELMDRKIFTGENVMLTRHIVKPSVAMAPHKHPHEQILVVLSGECDVTTGDVTEHLTPGGLALFPSNVEHSFINTLDEELVLLDIFAPIREDFLK